MNDRPDAIPTVSLPPDNPSRRGFLLRALSALGAAILAVFGRKDRLAAATLYDPPKAYRVYIPQLMRDGKVKSSDKNPSSDKTGDKDPISDKDPNEKDPTSDKDPNEKTPGEKDPISDKDPGEKTDEGVPDRPSSPSRGHLFDEWSPR